MKKLLAIILTLSILAGIGIVGVFADSTEQGYIVSPSEGDMEEILANLGEGGAVIGYVGDTDLSNNITVKDATAIQKHLASLVILTDAPLLLADTDRSGGVTIKDATAIQKWVAEIAVDAPVFHTLYKEGKDVVVTPATLDEAVLGNWKEQTDLADELNAKITNPFDARADRENHRLFSLMVKLDSFSATKEYLFKEDLTYLVAHSDVKTYADTVAELEEDLTKFIFTVTGATSVVDKKFGVILNALGVESVEELAQMLLTLREFNAVISDKSGTFFASEGTFTFDETTAYSYEIAGDVMTFSDAEGNVTNILNRVRVLDSAVLGNWKEQTDLADELNAKITNPFDARADRENHRLFSLMVKLDSFSATKEYLFKEDLTYLVAHSDVKTYADTVAELEEALTDFIFASINIDSVEDRRFALALRALGAETVSELAATIFTQQSYNSVLIYKTGTFFAGEGVFTLDDTNYTYEIIGDTMTFSDAEGNVTNILNRVKVLDSAVPGNWKEQTDLAEELNAKITNPIDSRADRENHRLFSLMVKLDSFSATKEYLFKEDLTYLVAHSDVKSYDDTVAELEEALTEFIFASINIDSVEDRRFALALRALGAETVSELAATIFTQQSYNSVLIFKTGTFFASEGVFTLDDTTYTYEIIGDTMTLTDAQGDIAKVLKKPKTIDSAIIGQWSAAVDLASKINNKIVSPVDDTKEKIKFKDYVSIESCPATMIYTFNDDGTFSITYPQRATYPSVVTELEEDLTAFLLAATGATSAEDRKFVVILNALGYESVSDFAAVLFTQAMYNEITAPSEGTYFAAEGTLVLNDKVTVAYTINNQILTITPEKGAFIRLQKLLDLDNGK